jgi:SEC-C motif-containing protein
MSCPCNSGKPLDDCCGPFLSGRSWPQTAADLMRARYAAFASGNVDFVHASHEPSTRDDLDRDATESWSKKSVWQGFEILSTEAGGVDDEDGTVEFVARYEFEGKPFEHHEVATFTKVDGRWYFVDGVVAGPGTYRREAPKVGRNDPCPCGSGKKFKKCCGGSGGAAAAS